MRPRFLLAVALAAMPPGAASRLAGKTGLAIILDRHPIIALANPACRGFAFDGGGVVLGTLFHRHGPARAIDALSAAEAAQVSADRGDTLLKCFWGGYVAAFPAPSGAQLLRDPSGALPCYHAAAPPAALFASDVDLLLESGLVHPAIDWPALARHLHSGGLPGSGTALGGISELLPGFMTDVPGEIGRQAPRWSPWNHVRPPEWAPAETAERLRRVVRQCVIGWTSSHPRLLASVSGGLDSSIVAACLAPGRGEVRCLTLYGADPGDDERGYARSLCEHLGLPLAERPFRLEDIDIAAPLGAHLPRPIGRTQEQAYERAHLTLAREMGADAFVTGNGGDNVFGYSQSAGAIADRFLREGMSSGVLRTLGDVCGQTGCGPIAAIRAAIRAMRRRRYRWRATPVFLHPDVQAACAGEALTHPWLDGPVDALPGKAGHIAALLRALPTLEPGRSRHASVLHPLLSQPVVEACLAIPSWEWRAGGIDRAVARQAFAADLPEAILRRRTKGGPDGFCAEIIRRHHARIRARLLDGALARHGLLDRAAVEEAIGTDRPLPGEAQVRILDLLDTEAWLDCWSARLAALSRPPGAAANAARSPNA